MESTITDYSFLLFAYQSLTEQQKYRIEVKYTIVKELQNLNGQKKRHVYRAIASKYGYDMRAIENLAVELCKVKK